MLGLQEEVDVRNLAALASATSTTRWSADAPGRGHDKGHAASWTSTGRLFRENRLADGAFDCLDGGARHLRGPFCSKSDLGLFDALRAEICAGVRPWSGNWRPGNDGKWKTPWRSGMGSEQVEDLDGNSLPAHSFVLRKLASLVNAEVQMWWTNFYEDGSVGCEFHHDGHCQGNVTAGASFGAARDLTFQHAETGCEHAFLQENGDVFTFNEKVDSTYMHGVYPINEKVGPRISVILFGKTRTDRQLDREALESLRRLLEDAFTRPKEKVRESRPADAAKPEDAGLEVLQEERAQEVPESQGPPADAEDYPLPMKPEEKAGGTSEDDGVEVDKPAEAAPGAEGSTSAGSEPASPDQDVDAASRTDDLQGATACATLAAAEEPPPPPKEAERDEASELLAAVEAAWPRLSGALAAVAEGSECARLVGFAGASGRGEAGGIAAKPAESSLLKFLRRMNSTEEPAPAGEPPGIAMDAEVLQEEQTQKLLKSVGLPAGTKDYPLPVTHEEKASGAAEMSLVDLLEAVKLARPLRAAAPPEVGGEAEPPRSSLVRFLKPAQPRKAEVEVVLLDKLDELAKAVEAAMQMKGYATAAMPPKGLANAKAKAPAKARRKPKAAAAGRKAAAAAPTAATASSEPRPSGGSEQPGAKPARRPATATTPGVDLRVIGTWFAYNSRYISTFDVREAPNGSLLLEQMLPTGHRLSGRLWVVDGEEWLEAEMLSEDGAHGGSIRLCLQPGKDGPATLLMSSPRWGDEVQVRAEPSDGAYFVDNSLLQAETAGVEYRCSRRLGDTEVPPRLAPWGTTVQGVDQGDGWLRLTDNRGEVGRHYLPMALEGVPVLVPRSRLWRSQPTNGVPVPIRTVPDLDGPLTGASLKRGEVFEITCTHKGVEIDMYLKLADGRGWVSSRSPIVGTCCVFHGFGPRQTARCLSRAQPRSEPAKDEGAKVDAGDEREEARQRLERRRLEAKARTSAKEQEEEEPLLPPPPPLDWTCTECGFDVAALAQVCPFCDTPRGEGYCAAALRS